jgi:hypothetical protein
MQTLIYNKKGNTVFLYSGSNVGSDILIRKVSDVYDVQESKGSYTVYQKFDDGNLSVLKVPVAVTNVFIEN